MKILSLKSIKDAHIVCQLSLVGARCELLVAKKALTLWANVILKQRDAVLAKVKDSMLFESFMDLRNAKLSSGLDLFLAEVLEKAIEKSSKVLLDEAIRKAVSCDKPASRGKKLHFSQSSCQQQQSNKSTVSSSGSSFQSSLTSSSSKASSSSSHRGKGKKFWRFIASLAAAGGGCPRSALACLAVIRHRRMDGCGSPGGIPHSILSPPASVAGTPGAIILCSRVGSGKSSAGGGLFKML